MHPPMNLPGGRIFTAVAGSSILIYLFWELRVRASAKLGKVPPTLTHVSDPKRHTTATEYSPAFSPEWLLF